MPIDSQRRKDVYRLVPEGALVNRKWLKSNALSGHAIDNLIKSNQLETVKNGVYKRDGSDVEWGDVVYFLQRRHGSDFVVGGITSLELQKMAHYLSMSEKKVVHLYGLDHLPSWINIVSKNNTFKKHSKGDILGSGFTIQQSQDIDLFTKILSWKNTKEGLKISIPERAILEVMYQVPHKISFEHADELMQGLNTLSPRSLQKLLELCGNIKVRRLFFWYAERHGHPWLSRIDSTKLDFGSGNRVIVKDGKLNKKYQITVPESYE